MTLLHYIIIEHNAILSSVNAVPDTEKSMADLQLLQTIKSDMDDTKRKADKDFI